MAPAAGEELLAEMAFGACKQTAHRRPMNLELETSFSSIPFMLKVSYRFYMTISLNLNKYHFFNMIFIQKFAKSIIIWGINKRTSYDPPYSSGLKKDLFSFHHLICHSNSLNNILMLTMEESLLKSIVLKRLLL